MSEKKQARWNNVPKYRVFTLFGQQRGPSIVFDTLKDARTFAAGIMRAIPRDSTATEVVVEKFQQEVSEVK